MLFFQLSKYVYFSIKARNLCLSVCLSVCSSNISVDQDQTDLRLTTLLLRGLRMCDVAFFWTAMVPLINYFINALPMLLALSTVATVATVAT